LLRNGTTTALVFAAVYPQSVDAFFWEASSQPTHDFWGNDGPKRSDFLDTPETSYQESKQLIQKWHKKGVYFMQ